MNMIKKIIAAAVSASLLLILMCGCANDEDAQYEHLKTDIVGMWMDVDGPVVDSNNPFGNSLRFYEFTSAGEVYYHFIFINSETNAPADGTMLTSTYYFDGNMLVNVVEGEEEGSTQKSGAIVDINDGIMTMSNNSGSSTYKKLSVEDTTGYAVFYKDEALAAKQAELVAGTEETADSSVSGDTEASSDTSETEASEESVTENAEASAETEESAAESTEE